MFSLLTTILVAATTLVIGGVLGGLLTRKLSSQEKKAQSLQAEVEKHKKQLSEYQQQVNDHFATTAKLVNQLTQNYRDVHEHLASDALKLANMDISRQLISDTNNDHIGINERKLNEQIVEPPKDWAPKTEGEEGMLSESYGLKDEEEISPPPHPTKQAH